MPSAMGLSASSTEFTTSTDVHYAWTGLTVDRQNCTPTRIEFDDMSFINLESGYVMVVPGSEASITVTKPGEEPTVITARSIAEGTRPAVTQTVTNHGSGAVVVQGAGVQYVNFS